MMFPGTMALGLAIEAAVGWPAGLYAAIGHPVTWAGRLIGECDRRFNRESDSFSRRKLMGVAVALGITLLSAGLADLVQGLFPRGWIGWVFTGLLAWPLLATRSLHDHVEAVARPLAEGDLPAARQALAMIVGRDVTALDEAGIARAALESLAESTCDGVVAPLFWGVLLGLPGLAAYKAINTMDSMIGHLSPRHAAFGWAAARIDDVANFLPARLSGLIYVALAGQGWQRAAAVMRADAGHHRSPNAGWPEAALAGALDVRLSGPRIYDGALTEEPWVNGTAPDPSADDLARGLRLYRLYGLVLGGLLLLMAVI